MKNKFLITAPAIISAILLFTGLCFTSIIYAGETNSIGLEYVSSVDKNQQNTHSFSKGFEIDLTSEQIQEAIDYGKTITEDNYLDATEEWRKEIKSVAIAPGRNIGFIIINSSFRKLVIDSYSAFKKYQELSPKEIKKIIKTNKNEIFFIIYVYGDLPDFAKGYHVVLKCKNKVLQPSTKQNESWANYRGGDAPSYAAYSAGLYYGFLFREKDSKTKKEVMVFNPYDTIILTVIPPDGEESNTEIDLSAMR